MLLAIISSSNLNMSPSNCMPTYKPFLDGAKFKEIRLNTVVSAPLYPVTGIYACAGKHRTRPYGCSNKHQAIESEKSSLKICIGIFFGAVK